MKVKTIDNSNVSTKNFFFGQQLLVLNTEHWFARLKETLKETRWLYHRPQCSIAMQFFGWMVIVLSVLLIPRIYTKLE
jgi:hypothetical protein